MNTNRLITYSLLSHINNTGTLVGGLLDIFLPLAKRALSKMNKEGVYSGKNISEIQKTMLDLYSIDIPLPVLKSLLFRISDEVNTQKEEKFILYRDGAFAIKDYVFEEFEDLIEEKNRLINEVEKLFKKFCKLNNIDKEEYSSIFLFLERNKLSISRYLSENHSTEKKLDYSTEAQFVAFFKQIPSIYKIIKELYLGSILSTYIEYSTNPIKLKVELLLDTNFIISLLDLNTVESTDTCQKLISISKHYGYKLSILSDTIAETKTLLLRRAEHFNASYLTKKVNPEDIYNACDRRGLNKTDLENIADNLEKTLNEKFEISIIVHTDKFVNKAKVSSEYKTLQDFRNSPNAALHDATAIYYVREQRGNKWINEFENVNCWFVNNSINIEYDDFSKCEKIFKNGNQPEIIKVDVLLNILWLSNPSSTKKIDGEEIVKVGLSSLISSTLNESLPRNAIIRELDDNIHKYAKDTLSDEQVVRVATRIANKQVLDIEELNQLAKLDKEKFVKRLENEAKKQLDFENRKYAQLDKIISEIERESAEFDLSKQKIDSKNQEIEKLNEELKKSKENERRRENEIRQINRNIYIGKRLSDWRLRSWIAFAISLLIIIAIILDIFYISDWNVEKVSVLYSEFKGNLIFVSSVGLFSMIFNVFVIKSLYDKYGNHSNIKSYIERIKIPENLREL